MSEKFCFACMSEMSTDSGCCAKCGFVNADYSAEPHQLPPGTIVNSRYKIGKVLGEGGFGITYVGIDTVLNLKVAVKEFYMAGYVNRNCTSSTVCSSVGSHSETFEKNREKFLDEARVLAKFAAEDGIVGIRDFFNDNNTAYIVMDFLSGKTLKEYLREKKKLSWDEVMTILAPVLHSLEVIHEQNIIHRDISPDNIMLVNDGKVKLLDFGAAREVTGGDNKSLSVMLKHGYAPEEQYRSKGVQGPWTDVYAICATIYKCLTGKVPDEAMERMLDDGVVPPFKAGAECTREQSTVLMKGLAVRKNDRYQTITEFLADVSGNNASSGNSRSSASYSGETVLLEKESIVPENEQPVFDNNETVLLGKDYVVPENNEVVINNQESTDVQEIPAQITKRKNKFRIPVIAAIAVVLCTGGILMAVNSGKNSKSSGSAVSELTGSWSLPEEFRDCTLKIDDKSFKIPATYQQFEDAGWIPSDGSELSAYVGAYDDYSSHVYLTNGYAKITSDYKNPSPVTITQKECPVTSINADYQGDKAVFEIGGGLVLGKTSLKEFKNAFTGLNSCYECETAKTYEKYIFYERADGKKSDNYKADADIVKRYTLMFMDIGGDDTDEYRLYSVKIENSENIIDMVDYSVSEEKYDYNADAAIKASPLYGWTYSAYGFDYTTFTVLDDFAKDGWKIEGEKPEYLASGYKADIKLRYDALTTADITVYNPLGSAMIPDHCIISSLTVKSTDQKRNDIWTLKKGNVSIEKGMKGTEIKKLLDSAGYSYLCDNDNFPWKIFTDYNEDSVREYRPPMYLYYNSNGEVRSVEFKLVGVFERLMNEKLATPDMSRVNNQ